MAPVLSLEESLQHASRAAAELRAQIRDAKDAWTDLTRQLGVHQVSMTALRTETREGLKEMGNQLAALTEAVSALTVVVQELARKGPPKS